MLAAKAIRKSGRRKNNPLTIEQKAEKAVANATRYLKPRLTVEQKAENVRIVTEKWYAESAQVAIVRLLHKRHRYAIRPTTVANSVVANALVSNKAFNVQPESDPFISSVRVACASREVQSDAQQGEAARARAIKRRQKKYTIP